MRLCTMTLLMGQYAMRRTLILMLMRLGSALQAYLDDFDKFCQKLGGATAEIMGDLLSFEVRTTSGEKCHAEMYGVSCWEL